MASLDSERQFSHFARHRAEQREARLIFMLAYPFCLVAAVAKRLSPKRARRAEDGAGRRRSVFGEAKAAAGSCVPFAFR